MTLSDFFSYSSSVPAGTISTSTKATETQEPSPCDADITTATFLIEPHHHQEQERGYEVDKYDGADKEDCNKIAEMFTLRLDKMWEYAHGHVSDTLRNPKVVLGLGWHDESNVPIGEVDVQFRAVSLVKVLVWPRWTVPYVDVKVQSAPAAKAFKSAFNALSTTAVLSTVIRRVQELSDPVTVTEDAGEIGGGRFDKVEKGVRGLLYYTLPLLFMGVPFPLMMLVNSKRKGLWGQEMK
ncbi:Hypothetical protein NocV09_02000220 [Nannochloropsis oceanica]